MRGRPSRIEKGPLRLLKELLTFSDAHLRHEIKDERENLLKRILYLLFLFSKEQSEALEVLCKKSMTSPAVSQLRNFYEAYLYARYLAGRQPRKRLALYSIEMTRIQLKMINTAKALIKKYPHLKNRDAMTTETMLNTEGQKKEQEIKTAKKSFNLKNGDQLPSLETISQIIDKGSTAKTKQGSSEQTYNLLYRYACTHVHPTPLALDRLLAPQKSEKGLNLSVLMITNALLIDFLKLLQRNKILDKPVPSRFTRKLNSLQKQHRALKAAKTNP